MHGPQSMGALQSFYFINMNNQITLEEALRLVTFIKDNAGKWRVSNVCDHVHGDVHGDVDGNVRGDVCGDVCGVVHGDVCGHVHGDVDGSVGGTISGKKWAFIETPREKLARLIKEKGDQELLKAFNELEDSDD